MPNNRIREVRKRVGLTQTQLAERVGKAQSEIARIEHPTVAPRPKTLRAVADALGVQVVDLITA